MAIIDPKKLVPDPRNFAKEFMDFLLKSNLLSLALAFVIGTGVTRVVNSIVGDLIMPVVAVLTPKGDWRGWTAGFWKFHWTFGSFLGTLLDFIILATIVFLITKALVRQAPPPPTKACAACKEGNHPEATRCKWCTSELPMPVAPPPAA